MNSAPLQPLLSASELTTLAVTLVVLLRAPIRGTLGARAAYWLWAAVPASAIVAILPLSERHAAGALAFGGGTLDWIWARLQALIAATHVAEAPAAMMLALWTLGAGATLGSLIVRQRTFVRSLGRLVQSPDGTWRSAAVLEPLLLGALRPRVLVPLDFERRYTAEEREWVLAHERAHMRRGDTVVNAFAAAWLCVFWFDPVMFWAMRLLRFDQDLACDATVLAAAGRQHRGRYAEALLKAQLAGEGSSVLPLACHWRSVHPLRRRVAALRRPIAGRVRHGIGVLLVAALVGSATLAARAVEPVLQSAQPDTSHAAASATPPVRAVRKVCPLTRRHADERRPPPPHHT